MFHISTYVAVEVLRMLLVCENAINVPSRGVVTTSNIDFNNESIIATECRVLLCL